MTDINFVRRWEYDGKEFTSKAEVVRYKSEQTLLKYTSNPSQMIAAADEVIALLRPFATPRTRKSKKGNGAEKAPAGAKASKNQAQAAASA